MQIYIHRDNQDFGPYPRETVMEYLEQGFLQTTDHAWHAGLADWKPLSQVLTILPTPAFAAHAPAAFTVRTPNQAQFRNRSAQSVQAPRKKKTGLMIGVNVTLIAFLAIGYVHFGSAGEMMRRGVARLNGMVNGGPRQEQQAAALAPVAASAPMATEPAAIVEATPVPVLAPMAAPAPPKAFDPADLAGNPAAWPKKVMLKQPVVFPAVYNSQVVGNVTVPAGTIVSLVEIKGEQVTVEYRGATQKLSWKLTNLEERAAQTSNVATAPARTTAANTPGGPAAEDSKEAPPGLGPQAQSFFGSNTAIR